MSNNGNPAINNSAPMDALTGRRSEESVLFSLDSFPAIASAQRPAAAANLRGGPSTRAPASEGSGLIDIRAMRVLMDGETAASPAARAAVDVAQTMPSFGGGGFSALSVEPLATVAPTAPAAAKPDPRGSQNLMFVLLIGLLGLGVLGLGAVLLLDQPRDTVVRTVVTAPETVAASDPGKADEQAPPPAPEQVAAVPAEPEPEPEATKPSTTNRRNRPGNTKPSTTPKTTSTSSSKASSNNDAPLDVDCLLDKNLPKCKRGGTKLGETAPKPPTPTTELANKLDQSQILKGIGPVKTAAKSCGSGTTVAIKFSVKGSTGAVISAQPLDEHSSSAVGKCVAKSASKATFPKFAAEQQGFTFKFRI